MSTQQIKIKLKSLDHALIDVATARIVDAATKSGCKISGPIPLPTDKEIVTILRSPHINKDSREQFEIRTHKRLIVILNPTSKTMDMLSRLDLPAGVDINMKF